MTEALEDFFTVWVANICSTHRIFNLFLLNLHHIYQKPKRVPQPFGANCAGAKLIAFKKKVTQEGGEEYEPIFEHLKIKTHTTYGRLFYSFSLERNSKFDIIKNRVIISNDAKKSFTTIWRTEILIQTLTFPLIQTRTPRTMMRPKNSSPRRGLGRRRSMWTVVKNLHYSH